MVFWDLRFLAPEKIFFLMMRSLRYLRKIYIWSRVFDKHIRHRHKKKWTGRLSDEPIRPSTKTEVPVIDFSYFRRRSACYVISNCYDYYRMITLQLAGDNCLKIRRCIGWNQMPKK
jgi:hypothetical protein